MVGVLTMELFSGLKRVVAREYVKFLKLGGMTVSEVEDKTGAMTNVDSFALQNLFSVHPWSYAGIYCIASSAAGTPLKLYKKSKSGDGDDDEVKDHDFLRLLSKPNKFMTGYDLLELMFIFLESTGNSYWLLDNGEASPLAPDATLNLKDVKEIWPIPPHMMKPLADREKFLRGYFMKPTQSAKGQTFATAEIAHFQYANPLSMYDGQGGLQAAKGSITGDIYAEKFNNNFFKNGGLPPAFLKTDKNLTQEQIREFKEQWATMYQGVKNAHKLAVLHSGLDLAVTNTSRKDMEFLGLQKEARERTLATLGVPMVMISGSEGVTYANAKEAKRIFWENTMLPKFRKVCAMLTMRLHQLGESEDLYFAFDTSDILALQEDFKVNADTAKIWFEIGVPRNTLIKCFGPQNMEIPEDGIGGETGFVPARIMTITDAATISGPEYTDAEGTPEDAPPPGAPPKPKKKPSSDPADSNSTSADAGVDNESESEKTMAAQHTRNVQKRLDDVRWKNFQSAQKADIARVRAVVRKLFGSQRKRIIAKIKEHYHQKAAPSVDVFLLNQPDEIRAWEKATRQPLSDAYNSFGAAAMIEVGSSDQFDIESPRAIQFISKRLFKFASDVNETTEDRVRTILEEQIADGVSQADLIGAIKDEFDFAETYRAARIARTEVGTAANGGTFEGYRQSGVETKRWISSRDSKVRDTHAAADGEQADVLDPFDVGGALLMFPGDPDGPAEEIINCRCTITAIIDRSPKS